MRDPALNEAAIPNPALASLKVLVGSWKTTGTHPYFPTTTFHGRTTFEWMMGGAFLMMRSEIDEPGIPSGISIFGTDDVAGKGHMLYFDERGVSRLYQFSCDENEWRWWRDTPEFSQRMTGIISSDGRTITAQGEMSRDGGAWEPDLALTYTRID